MQVVEQIHIIVSGRVQGVGFRAATQKAAQKLNLRGWVRNTKDGRVEIQATGSSLAINELLVWCRQGPILARVDHLEVLSRKPDTPKSVLTQFEVRYN